MIQVLTESSSSLGHIPLLLVRLISQCQQWVLCGRILLFMTTILSYGSFLPKGKEKANINMDHVTTEDSSVLLGLGSSKTGPVLGPDPISFDRHCGPESALKLLLQPFLLLTPEALHDVTKHHRH